MLFVCLLDKHRKMLMSEVIMQSNSELKNNLLHFHWIVGRWINFIVFVTLNSL